MKKDLITLLKTQWVTPMVALNQLQIMTLSQRVSELRAAGVNVIDKWVKTDTKRFKAYRIVGKV